MTFSEYIEQLAREHKAIGHKEGECHFSDLSEDAQNAFSHLRMHYPCVVVDEGGSAFGGSDSQPYLTDYYMVLLVDHVRDTGDANEVRSVFQNMKGVAKDFLKRMVRDRRTVRLMNRFSLMDVEMERVYLKDAALYGYAVYLRDVSIFTELDCDNAFEIED